MTASAVVAANVLRLRSARGLSTVRLSTALREIGHSVHPTAITRIEKGERRVTVEDLVALAAVFEVTPAEMLKPQDHGPDASVGERLSRLEAAVFRPNEDHSCGICAGRTRTGGYGSKAGS